MKQTVIAAKNLCKSFTNGTVSTHVLKNISLDIYEGDFTIIMGSSGSGKSTLLYSLSSMDSPTSGSISLNGHQLTACSGKPTRSQQKELEEIRSQEISYIFQNINLLSDLTAFENICYPACKVLPKKEAQKRTSELLSQFGLSEQADKYPSELSGGQQQRIAIARAVVTRPKIIFADEPTGALNSSSGKQVLDLLTGLNQQGQSIVMVTHDIRACVRGSRLLYLADGSISGELLLGNYTPENQAEREERIFHFLETYQW